MAQRILIFLLLVQMPSSAFSQAGREAFATRAYRGRSSLNVDCSLDLAGSMSSGVAKVVVKDSKGASVSDRNLVVILYVKSWGTFSDPIGYRYPLTLAQGQTAAQLEIPYIITGAQYAWDVGVFEDGRDIEDKRKRAQKASFQWSYNANNQQTFQLAGLVATDVDLGVESKSINLLVNKMNLQPTTLVAAGMGAPAAVVALAKIVRVDEASEDWQRYFPYTVWVASGSAIAEINQRQPQVAKALRTYLSAGGNLLVYDAKSQNWLKDVNRLLGNSNEYVEVTPWDSLTHNQSPWWTIVDEELPPPQPKRSRGKPPVFVEDPASINGWGVLYDSALLVETIAEAELGPHRSNLILAADLLGFSGVEFLGFNDSFDYWSEAENFQFYAAREYSFSHLNTEKILHRPYLRGRVLVAQGSLDELPDGLLEKAINSGHLSAGWQLANHDFDGNWFWRNLITRVGKPPIWAFCAMVTLFGALLGPGLLYFTGRMQRRSLMIFLVPLISFIAILMIITYGVVHEGFDTHIRIASVTTYDPSANVAFAWSRQNYFSGLPPREGLHFPVDAFVRPVHSDDQGKYSGVTDPRQGVRCIVDMSDQQNWRGWLGPRQHQQLLVGHTVDAASIPIATAKGERGQLLLTNRTSITLPIVVWRDGDDNYFTALELGPSEIRNCQAVPKSTAAATVARVGAEVKPRIPVEMDGSSGSLLNFGRNGFYSSNGQMETADILNVEFSRVLTDQLELQPFEFATLVPEFEPVIVPLKGKQANNLNLVIGVDPW